MAKRLLIILSVFIYVNSFSQIKKPENIPFFDYQPLHFGYAIAINTMDFAIKPNYNVLFPDSIQSIEVNRYPGFGVAIVSNLRITDDLDIRFLPGLIWGQRDIIYTIDDGVNSTTNDLKIRVESIMIETPILVKYKAHRLNNHRPYVIGGINYRFDTDGKELDKNVARKNQVRKLNRSDLYYEVGVGADFYMPYFKLATELKFSVGIIDILHRDNSKLTSSIDKLNSKMVILTFYFE